MLNNNFTPAHRPPNTPNTGYYIITDDQLELFPMPSEKPQITPFQRVYGANSHQATIRKATKIIKKFKKNHE